MNKQLIRDLAVTGGIYDCICDPYDKLENGDYYSSVMVDLERFAEKIVRECIEVANKNRTVMEIKTNTQLTADAIKKHFGVEE
jgi:hypothetical protein